METETEPEGITEVTDGWTLQTNDKAVIETEKKCPGVSVRENERLETEVIEDDPEVGDDDEIREGSDEDNDCVPQSDIDDAVQNKPEL